MRTPNINLLIKKIYDCKNAGVREVKIPIEDALSAVLELSLLITDNHLISFDDLKEALINTKSYVSEPNKKITGGTF